MQWTEAHADWRMHLTARIELLRAVITQTGDRADLWLKLGRLLEDDDRPDEAVDAFEAALALDRANFPAWANLLHCHIMAGHPQTALDRAAPEAPGVAFVRGLAQLQLGNVAAGRSALRAAVGLNDAYSAGALKRLLEHMAKDEDGNSTVALCNGLPAALRGGTSTLAHLAIALSRTGREEEASRLIDLDRHVLRVAFEPPTAFGAAEDFNREIASLILAEQVPRPRSNAAMRDVQYQPRVTTDAHFAALYSFIRLAMERFVAEMPAMGLADVMPAPPRSASLHTANTVLRLDGRNGQHIHSLGYVSAVYHVAAPKAEGDRGALVLGCCDEHTGGYKPCWGTRIIRPEPGWLTLFASHVFHDVIPTGLDVARVSIPADMVSAE